MRRASYGRIAGYTLVVVAVLVGLYFLYMIRAVIFLLLLAILIATAIEPLVYRLRSGPFSKGQGVLIVYTGIMLIIGGVGFLLVPVVVTEGSNIAQNYPQILENTKNLAYSLDGRVLGPTLDQTISQFAVPRANQEVASAAVSAGLTLVEAIGAAVTVFVLAFYWVSERLMIKKGFVRLFPQDRRLLVVNLWSEVERVLGGWVRGQLLLMTFIGVAAAIGYSLIGLKYALVLAVLAGLLEVVPLVGPWLGAIPALLVALTQDFRVTLLVAAYLLVIQIVEGYILVPRVMEQTVGISPLTVILGLLVGASIGGIGGAVVAVPLAGALQVAMHFLLPSGEQAVPTISPRPNDDSSPADSAASVAPTGSSLSS